MNAAAMRERCPGARFLGLARLLGYRFVIARTGYGGLAPDPAAEVHGVMWELTPADLVALDAFEGVPEGLYRRATLSIDGGPAMIYVPSDPGDQGRGTPRPGYLEDIVNAAAGYGFPETYLAELKGWM